MKINIVGSQTTGYVGEIADELLIANAFQRLGHKVNHIPRDIWKAYTDGYAVQENWKQYLDVMDADINIVCKWHHFNDPKYISFLRQESKAPVIYWTWDYMDYDDNFHTVMALEADLFLTNDIHHADGVKGMYFPFDAADDHINRIENVEKTKNVVFFGSHFKKGDRIDWIKEINKIHPIEIYSWNYQEWQKEGLVAYPAVYGDEFSQIVAQSKVILQFSVNDHCWGYWSNRVGKVLTLGGFLLARYAPGMELFLRDGVEYFSDTGEANQKIAFYLEHDDLRQKIADKGYKIGRDRFTVIERVKDLQILIERFLLHGI